jgi:NAD(P)-dependent dehydrogenase (short-subunit alcohol dehydrogenase family)
MEPKVAVVTGGASGMGRIYALRMARRGTRVAILDLNEAALEATAKESPNLRAWRCDTSDLAQVEEVFGKIAAELGPIDRVVHCAAIMPTSPLMDQPTALIHKMMAVNYGGTVNVTKTVLPEMQRRGNGELVIFGSIAGSVLAPHLGSYCATKAATNAFAEVLIEETRGSGPHLMLVCPPMVNTPLLKQATENSNPKNIRMSIEKGRLADPEVMIDEVERGLARRQEILIPGAEAKITLWMRRFFPRLLWKVIHRSNQ